MDLCAHCHTAIVDPNRAWRDLDGFWLDPECARELAREGQLKEVDAPIVDGRGRLKGYLRMHWSGSLDSFVTIPGWC